MKTALFTNFTEQEFTGYWDGKAKKFDPGQSLYMPDYLARHFAKHLTNRELLRVDANGNPVYRDGEKMTSPKKPEDVPLFMEIFNKAYAPDEEEEALGDKKDDIDTLINVANKNRQAKLEKASETPPEKSKPARQDPNEPQVIVPPDFNEDEEDEGSFEGDPDEVDDEKN